jgi:hypothetical protein
VSRRAPPPDMDEGSGARGRARASRPPVAADCTREWGVYSRAVSAPEEVPRCAGAPAVAGRALPGGRARGEARRLPSSVDGRGGIIPW